MPDARAALDRLGLRTCPNRALVVQWEAVGGRSSVESDRDVTTVLHTIDDICERIDNVVHAYIRGRGVCIFIHERPRARRHPRLASARDLAQTILHAVAERSALRVRVGIGETKADFARLAESYREARVALAATDAAIASYTASSDPEREATALSARIPELLVERRFEEARLAMHALPLQVQRQFGANLPASRRALLSALGIVLATVPGLGFDASLAAQLRADAGDSLARAGSAFDLQEAYSRVATGILDELEHMHLDKGARLVNRACRLIDRSMAAGTAMTQRALAGALGVSASHLSRLFRLTTGDTFERYVVRRRLELARRLLLDPAHNVSTVARQCGFRDASYFARVFRRTMGCSPTEYSRQPLKRVL
jgi:AraC-like DNA-binding protein